MPGGDRTGPMGMGQMTGRGAGYCAGSNVPGFMNRGFGFLGRGRGGGGGGRGWRNMFYTTGLTGWQRAAMDAAATTAANAAPAAAANAAPTADAEKDFLATQVGTLQTQLDELKQRLAELEAGKE